MKTYRKIFGFTMTGLALTLLACPAAKADCMSRLAKNLNTEAKIGRATGGTLLPQVLAVLVIGAVNPPLAGALTSGITTEVEGDILLTFDSRSRADTYYLLKEAHAGKGDDLDRFYEDIKSVRPDLSKQRVTQLLVESDEKEYVCNPNYSSVRMMREFMNEGDLERAESGVTHNTLKISGGEAGGSSLELPYDVRSRLASGKAE